MSTTQVTSLDDRLAKIAEKSGKPIADVKKAYDAALEAVPKNVKSDNRRQNMAVLIVNKDFLINTKSTALAYEGIIIGAEKTRDLMKFKRDAAFKAYDDDPQAALDNGVVAVEGENVIPLDTREEVYGKKNAKFGQPLKKEMLLRELHIVARKPGETEWVKGTMNLWNEQTKLVIPTLKLVSFKANGELKDDAYDLRSSVDTQFEISENELSADEIVSVIDDKFQDDFRTLKECWEYHNEIKNDKAKYWSSLVVTEGAVTWIQEFDKSIKVVLTDDSLNDLEFHERGITCWLPKDLKGLIDFGKKSIVTIIARTNEGNYYDSEKGHQTDDKILQLNAFSLIGRPGLTTEPIQEGESI
jgi:hypothetical protein